jgi:hypothetical protein
METVKQNRLESTETDLFICRHLAQEKENRHLKNNREERIVQGMLLAQFGINRKNEIGLQFNILQKINFS